MIAPVLVVYDTRYGTCAKIATHVEARLRRLGYDFDVEQTPGGRPLSLDEYSAIIVIAAVYNQRHPESIEHFVRAHHRALAYHPTAFISVSLGAAAKLRFVRAGVHRVAERLFHENGWHPKRVLFTGGSLDYPIYSPTMRRWMRTAAFVFGLPTDTSHRHELTKWDDVDNIVDDVLDDIDVTRDLREAATFA